MSMLSAEGLKQSSGRSQARGVAVQDKDDHALFDEIFLPYLAEAYRLAEWLTGSRPDAEDVVQDAALRAFRGIKGFGAVNARAWSLTIVRNTAYTWLMKNRPKAVVFTEELGTAEQQQIEVENTYAAKVQTPEQAVLQKADVERIRHALDRLAAPYREVIVLREMHQLNYRDIAEIASVPIGTVMSRLARARQQLIEILGDEEFGEQG
jgi:RNA polymerase sigma-70 factor (ECF subfamily)